MSPDRCRNMNNYPKAEGEHCLGYLQESNLRFASYNWSGRLTLWTNSWHPRRFYRDVGFFTGSNCSALEQCSALGKDWKIDVLNYLVSDSIKPQHCENSALRKQDVSGTSMWELKVFSDFQVWTFLNKLMHLPGSHTRDVLSHIMDLKQLV